MKEQEMSPAERAYYETEGKKRLEKYLMDLSKAVTDIIVKRDAVPNLDDDMRRDSINEYIASIDRRTLKLAKEIPEATLLLGGAGMPETNGSDSRHNEIGEFVQRVIMDVEDPFMFEVEDLESAESKANLALFNALDLHNEIYLRRSIAELRAYAVLTSKYKEQKRVIEDSRQRFCQLLQDTLSKNFSLDSDPIMKGINMSLRAEHRMEERKPEKEEKPARGAADAKVIPFPRQQTSPDTSTHGSFQERREDQLYLERAERVLQSFENDPVERAQNLHTELEHYNLPPVTIVDSVLQVDKSGKLPIWL